MRWLLKIVIRLVYILPFVISVNEVSGQTCGSAVCCTSYDCGCSIGGSCDIEGYKCGTGLLGICQCSYSGCINVDCNNDCSSPDCPAPHPLKKEDMCVPEPPGPPPPDCGPIACGSATCDGCAGEDCCTVGCRTGTCPAGGSLTVTLHSPADYASYYRPRCYLDSFLAHVEWYDSGANDCDRSVEFNASIPSIWSKMFPDGNTTSHDGSSNYVEYRYFLPDGTLPRVPSGLCSPHGPASGKFGQVNPYHNTEPFYETYNVPMKWYMGVENKNCKSKNSTTSRYVYLYKNSN
jgi:hypothetical protein